MIWWLTNLPSNTTRAIRFWWQRRTRGWDDSEIWSLDVTIARFLEPRVRALAANLNGAPSGYPTGSHNMWFSRIVNIGEPSETDFQQWEVDLLALANAAAEYVECEDHTEDWWDGVSFDEWNERETRAHEEMTLRLEWMAEWFGHLWD